jgi:hypothetical protein
VFDAARNACLVWLLELTGGKRQAIDLTLLDWGVSPRMANARTMLGQCDSAPGPGVPEINHPEALGCWWSTAPLLKRRGVSTGRGALGWTCAVLLALNARDLHVRLLSSISDKQRAMHGTKKRGSKQQKQNRQVALSLAVG